MCVSNQFDVSPHEQSQPITVRLHVVLMFYSSFADFRTADGKNEPHPSDEIAIKVLFLRPDKVKCEDAF
jgi:hypothetical protein